MQPQSTSASTNRSRARVDELAERARAIRGEVAAIRAVETSGDGAVSVAVGAQGTLEDLRLGTGSDSMPREELAATILRLARKAHVRAAGAMADALAPLIGENSAAMAEVRSSMPADTPDDADRTTTAPAPAAPAGLAAPSQFGGLNEEQLEAAELAPRPLYGSPATANDPFPPEGDDETGYSRG